jgi:hypothetical protein
MAEELGGIQPTRENQHALALQIVVQRSAALAAEFREPVV